MNEISNFIKVTRDLPSCFFLPCENLRSCQHATQKMGMLHIMCVCTYTYIGEREIKHFKIYITGYIII